MNDYFDSLLLALQLAGNFTTEIVEVPIDPDTGNWNASNKTWPGHMDLLENNSIDILVLVSPTTNMLKVADLSPSITKLKLTLYIRQPSSQVRIFWSAYFKVHKITVFK